MCTGSKGPSQKMSKCKDMEAYQKHNRHKKLEREAGETEGRQPKPGHTSLLRSAASILKIQEEPSLKGFKHTIENRFSFWITLAPCAGFKWGIRTRVGDRGISKRNLAPGRRLYSPDVSFHSLDGRGNLPSSKSSPMLSDRNTW